MKIRTMLAMALIAATPLLATACAETDNLAGPAPEAQYANKGVSNPNTDVTAAFVVHIDGSYLLRAEGSTYGPNGRVSGYCFANGQWRNSAGNLEHAVPHQKCIIGFTEGVDITVTFSSVANYVLATAGNVQLNFTQSCSTNELLVTTCSPNGVQYKKAGDNTLGFGGLSTTDADGRTWTINFGQDVLQSSGNLLTDPPRKLYLNACNADLGCWPGQLTW